MKLKPLIKLALASLLAAAAFLPLHAQETRTISLGDLFKKVLSKPHTPARSRGPQDDLARLHERYGATFVATSIPGIYAVQAEGKFGSAAQLVTGDGDIVMNSGSLGMQRGADGPRLTETEQEAIIRPLLRHFATDKMLQFGLLAAPLRVVVLSAVDCGYCAKLEPALAARNMRYAVIPGALFDENQGLVHRIYCAPDPGKAWLQSLSKGKAPTSKDTRCDFDREHFWVLNGLLGGSTPRLVFADGDLMRPAFDAAGIARIQAKLKELERVGIAFE